MIHVRSNAGRFSSSRRGIAHVARASTRAGNAGFTLAEVLAALLFMAILVPVTMQSVSVASRAGMLGQRKATAMRVAERVLEEVLVTDLVSQGASNGVATEGDVSFPWTMKADPWSMDAMTQVTIVVTFDVQGHTYDVGVSTLYDPAAERTAATTVTGTVAAR